jgi:hypothetical protein
MAKVQIVSSPPHPHRISCPVGTEGFSSGLQPHHDANHALPSSVEIRNTLSSASTIILLHVVITGTIVFIFDYLHNTIQKGKYYMCGFAPMLLSTYGIEIVKCFLCPQICLKDVT